MIINVAKDNTFTETWQKASIVGVNNRGPEVAINDVLHVPDLRANLTSVKKLVGANIKDAWMFLMRMDRRMFTNLKNQMKSN